jgi:hypothetical protein
MVAPLHLGLEHPNVLWLVAAALAAFATGLGIRTWQDRRANAGDADPERVENVE